MYISKGVLDEFYNRTGIQVNYLTFPSTDIGIQQLRTNTNNNYDLIIMSQYPDLAILKQAHLIQPIDITKIKYISHIFKYVDTNYCIPYISGSTGILYNKVLVEKYLPEWTKDSWNIFFDPQLASKIVNKFSLLDNKSDVLASYIRYLHYNNIINNININVENISNLHKYLIQLRPYIKRFASGISMNNMIAIQTYSSYANKAMQYNKDLIYIIPKEGSELWMDVMMIGKNAPPEVYDLINHILSPEMMRLAVEELNFNLNTNNENTNLSSTSYVLEDDYDIDILWMEFLLGHNIIIVQYTYIFIIILAIIYFMYIMFKKQRARKDNRR